MIIGNRSATMAAADASVRSETGAQLVFALILQAWCSDAAPSLAESYSTSTSGITPVSTATRNSSELVLQVAR
jgi:hypothetical protein